MHKLGLALLQTGGERSLFSPAFRRQLARDRKPNAAPLDLWCTGDLFCKG